MYIYTGKGSGGIDDLMEKKNGLYWNTNTLTRFLLCIYIADQGSRGMDDLVEISRFIGNHKTPWPLVYSWPRSHWCFDVFSLNSQVFFEIQVPPDPSRVYIYTKRVRGYRWFNGKKKPDIFWNPNPLTLILLCIYIADQRSRGLDDLVEISGFIRKPKTLSLLVYSWPRSQ